VDTSVLNAVETCRSVLFNYLLASNPLGRWDCSRNLMQWHKGLFLVYSKWTETSFPVLSYARKNGDWNRCM